MKQRELRMNSKRDGGAFVVAGCYALWGCLVLFWNLLSHVDSMFVLSQRILWSMILLATILLLTGQGKVLRDALRDGRTLLLSLACGALVTTNWGVYIYAVNSGHVLDASLGYFIEPILVGLLGVIVFREKLSVAEKITFVCGVLGLGYMLLTTGQVPALSLLIGGSFAAYGAVKKAVHLSAGMSLFLETLTMAPFALLYMAYAVTAGGIDVGELLPGAKILLLPAIGVVTTVPLFLFNIGVQKIPYYLAGILMYINPTLQFLLGIFYGGEMLDQNRLVAFSIIWIGVLFTLAEKLRLMIRQKRMTEK